MLRAALLRSSRAATSKLVASTSRPWTIRGLATSASTQAAAVPYKTHTSKNGVLAHTFFHDATSTWQYLVADDLTKTAVLIDPVLDFDAATLKVTTDTADSLVGFLQQNKYQLRHILETHAHADHLTAAQYFKTQFQAPVGIGAGILAVQKRAAADYDIPADELQGVFDNLWENGQTFQLGRNELAVMHLPGHTPDHVGYRCDNFVFVGDSLFLPDVGSARADFPGGSVVDLYASAQKLLALPDDVRIFSGHDYPGEDRHHSCSSTVAEQRELNKHLRHGTDEKEFSSMRARRDATLAAPRLLHQSLQVNLRGGNMPRPNAAGHQLMKLPIKF